MGTLSYQSHIGVSIIIKPASLHFIRYIAAGLGAQLTLYVLVGLLPGSSSQTTQCEYNLIDDIILGLGH